MMCKLCMVGTWGGDLMCFFADDGDCWCRGRGIKRWCWCWSIPKRNVLVIAKVVVVDLSGVV